MPLPSDTVQYIWAGMTAFGRYRHLLRTVSMQVLQPGQSQEVDLKQPHDLDPRSSNELESVRVRLNPSKFTVLVRLPAHRDYLFSIPQILFP